MDQTALKQITEELSAARAKGMIWNVDFEDLKFRLGRLIWKASDEKKDLLWKVEQILEAQRVHLTFCYLSSGHDLLATVKKITVAAQKAKLFDHPAILAFLAAWKPFTTASELLVSLKTLVQKGRRPNPEAEARKERSLENTGTCGCCNRNIKLEPGQSVIWDHGFSIKGRGHGFGAGYKTGGSCFGTGYKPIETSPQVWKDMLAAWEKRAADLPGVIERLTTEIAGMKKPKPPAAPTTQEDADYAKRYFNHQQTLRLCQHELSNLTTAIPEMHVKLANWAPRPLPGTRSKSGASAS